ncbi:MAG: 3-keto-disaccharide hydrolase [Rubripirellula sp.]
MLLFAAAVGFAEETGSKSDEKNPHSSNKPVFLEPQTLTAEGFRPLFVGDDLEQWRVEQGHLGHWTVEENVLHYDGKAEQRKSFDKSLWTKDPFGDVELYVEWCLSAEPRMKEHPIVLWNGDFLRDADGNRITRPHMDAGDSGIYFRGHFPCQANIWSQALGSGEINGYRTNRNLPVQLRQSCLPFENADRPLGEWNVFRIRLKNSRMTVNLNGRRVLQSGSLPDLPELGPIGLQHHGDPIEFRNIWVKELARNE